MFNEMFPPFSAHGPAVWRVATGWVRTWALSAAEHAGTRMRTCMDARRHEYMFLVKYGAQPPVSSSQHGGSS